MSQIFLKNSLDTLNHDRTITHKIITGDFNIDLIKFNHNTTTEEYLEMLLKIISYQPSFYQLQQLATHVP